MLPATLAPLDPHKTRALTTIYAPRKLKTRKNKTAQTRMLENDLPVKPTLSPFHPLPAIGQKLERSKTKIYVFNLNKSENDSDRNVMHDVLKPLTPLRIHGFTRKKSLDHLEIKKPQLLLRENTYDVLEPIYLNPNTNVTNRDPYISRKKTEDSNSEYTDVVASANFNANTKSRRRDTSVSRKATPESSSDCTEKDESKVSPKTRFKNAALQIAKLSSTPETGKLLSLRERQTFTTRCEEVQPTVCRLQELPRSPAQTLNKLSEIFQCLDMKGHKDKMKKENSWF